MPAEVNSPSMPKVRASSGTIGTTRSPMSSSRSSWPSMRTVTMVVDASRSPEPSSSDLKRSSGGVLIAGQFTRRSGRNPPSARRRESRYCISSLSSAGR